MKLKKIWLIDDNDYFISDLDFINWKRGASAVSLRAEAWRNKAQSHTHYHAVHVLAAPYSVRLRPGVKLH